ncbi:MAG: GIY-YIG nuclease family protein, partial [Pseudomonadales bacterium]|nr:GIY-YIG nuclease family protein [Pseudomonadales bacterium]
MRNIYIYTTPNANKDGIIKIGDASDVEKRIKEQLNTASSFQQDSLEYTLLYQTKAIKEDGTPFRDHEIHAILEYKGYPRRKITKDNQVLKSSTEWFEVDVEKVIHLIEQFKAGKKQEEIQIERFQDFPMRPEQLDAVNRSKTFLSQKKAPGETLEMLWNAKMRFGKTFTAYQLARSMSWTKVLVLTYKPAVEDAWKKDLEHHIDFKDYVFLRGDTLLEINDYLDKSISVVAFASYQDLLGDNGEGGIKARHEVLFNTHWDAVIIDEFHYGAGTKKAKEMMAEQIAIESDSEPSDKQLEQAKKEFYAEEDDKLAEEKETEAIVEVVEKAIISDSRLYLSGTPFKAIANAQFPQEAIYNWTYTDEQKAKEQWALENAQTPEENPYLSLPQIQMYLYKVSNDLIQA